MRLHFLAVGLMVWLFSHMWWWPANELANSRVLPGPRYQSRSQPHAIMQHVCLCQGLRCWSMGLVERVHCVMWYSDTIALAFDRICG